MTKKITILGSTGSIGTQTLDIVNNNKDRFTIYALVANNNWQLLVEQALIFRPEVVVIANERYYTKLKEALADTSIHIASGDDSITEVASNDNVDIVVTAMVGFSGLKPTIAALQAGKTIALANKETLVVAGDLIMNLKRQYNATILPVDSEHSAIYQCLIGEQSPPEKIILTASGGPFLGFTQEQLLRVTKEQALKHPRWSMGAKVSIDSASLMNKGLEMIEAHWLFDQSPEDIDVVIHPQSIIHSMVCFRDGSYKAQLGITDMRLPISYAIGLENRIANQLPRLDFAQLGSLTFGKPDCNLFPNLTLAYEAIKIGGSAPCVLNAANEMAVEIFLRDKISFTKISHIIERQLYSYHHHKVETYDDYQRIDSEIRQRCIECL